MEKSKHSTFRDKLDDIQYMYGYIQWTIDKLYQFEYCVWVEQIRKLNEWILKAGHSVDNLNVFVYSFICVDECK